MKLSVALVSAALILGNAASAQDSGSGFNGGANAGSESTSGSQSYSGINFNQADGHRGTPSMGAPTIAAECGGASGAASGPGFGISLGGGEGSRSCNLRADSAMLAALAGNQVALLHICLSTTRTGQASNPAKTLQAAGLCPREAGEARPAARPSTAHGSVCEYGPSGALRVSITPGFTQSQAVRSCRASLR